MNKISIKSFLFENGLISEISADWKKDFLLGSKGMTKTTEDVLNYVENIYFTAFDGEDNVRAINKKMVNWLIKQIVSMGGPANIGTTDRDKMITIFSWLRIAGSEGKLPTLDLNSAFELSNKKLEEKGKKETAQKAADEFPEPPITKVEEEGLVKRVYTIPDGSGRVWVKVNTQRAGEFFDKLCDANKAYGVGCQSVHSGMMHSQHRAGDKTTYTLLGPEKGKKVPITTLMSLSVDTASKNMIEAKQVENQEVGTNLYGWDDLFEQFVNFLGTSIAKQTIDKTTDTYALAWAFRNKKFDLINRLDLIRPDFITNSKRVILSSDGGKEWFETRSLDAVEALTRFGPLKFIQNIEGYTKSASFKDALKQLAPLLPELAEKYSDAILSKIDYLLEILPSDDFKKIISKVGLRNYITSNITDFKKMLKKLKSDNLKDSKAYKELFNSILENYFEDIVNAYNLKGPAGVDKFIDFLEMPKSDKHKFLRRDSEGNPIGLKKVVSVNPENQERTEKEEEFPLTDSHTIASKKERRDLLKNNESFIKSLIDGSDEKKDIDFLKIYFLETSAQERQKELKAEKDRVVEYYDNPENQNKTDFINGIPMPGIFKFYQMLNRGVGHGSGTEEVGGVSSKKIPTYKFDLEDLRNEQIINEIGSYFRALITGSPKGKMTTEIRYEILFYFLFMLKTAGESKEKIIDTIKQYDPANLPAYKNTSVPISYVAYRDYYKLFNTAGLTDSEVLKLIKENSEELTKKMTYGDYEELIKSFSVPHYNVSIGDMVEFLGEDTTEYNERGKLVKKKMSLAYLFMGRKYKISDIDVDEKDETGNKSAKIKVIDNRGKETDWMKTSDFNVKTKYINESTDVRKYISKKILDSYKKIKNNGIN